MAEQQHQAFGRAHRLRRLCQSLLPASRGYGPFLQRDYWGVIADCRMRPSELAALVAERFCDFSPAELAAFRRSDGDVASLQVGDELVVEIRMAGNFRVRVTHRDRNSLTLCTLDGHPEAGRITFGSYRNEDGDVLFHIRSRARSGSKLRYFGFVVAGEAMQTTTWTDFIDRVAAVAGTGVKGAIRAQTAIVRREDEETMLAKPTFWAQAD